MIIKGFERFTLVDFPGVIACTVFLFGCNLRCSYCHNPGLVVKSDTAEISQAYILDFLSKRKGQLEGVCFTGGEPLLTLDRSFVQTIKQMGFLVKIDTNGCFPEKLEQFVKQGLVDYVAMDIKSSPSEYSLLVKRPIILSKLEQSMRIISQLPSYEFRTTVIPQNHSTSKMLQIKHWLLSVTCKPKLKAFYIQPFVCRSGRMLDGEFDNTADASFEFVKELHEQMKDSFEICEIRF